MNGIESLWMVAALASLAAVMLPVITILRRGQKRSTRATQAAWLVAATTSGTMLVFIGAQVVDILPNATAIDVGALAVTGVLTGMFLAFALLSNRSSTVG